ncbi:peptidase S10, serine carboxypeptidase, partial [Conidiobolus coronatus NRRL 28638]
YSGYLQTQKDKNYYFWFFESRSQPSTDPIILWLNGGPGSTSFSGLLTLNGPCRLNKYANATIINPHSWNNNANVIYLDQPLGVGYSYGPDSATNSVEVGEQVYEFLQKFFNTFPKYRNLDFHVTGESYAGHYIPSIGKVIKDKNKNPYTTYINLKSVAIGNGLINPTVQYPYYINMACNSTYGAVIPKSICDSWINGMPKCISQISDCSSTKNTDTCANASNYCNELIFKQYLEYGLEPNDVRTKANGTDQYKSDPANNFIPFLNRIDIKGVLGANANINFASTKSNTTVYNGFINSGDWAASYHQDIAQLLNNNISVLNYAGDADFSCNWYGVKAFALELDWKGKSGFNSAQDLPLTYLSNGVKYGQYRTYGNFSFVRVYEAGHMVPYYQPAAALDMINRWLSQSHF